MACEVLKLAHESKDKDAGRIKTKMEKFATADGDRELELALQIFERVTGYM